MDAKRKVKGPKMSKNERSNLYYCYDQMELKYKRGRLATVSHLVNKLFEPVQNWKVICANIFHHA